MAFTNELGTPDSELGQLVPGGVFVPAPELAAGFFRLSRPAGIWKPRPASGIDSHEYLASTLGMACFFSEAGGLQTVDTQTGILGTITGAGWAGDTPGNVALDLTANVTNTTATQYVDFASRSAVLDGASSASMEVRFMLTQHGAADTDSGIIVNGEGLIYLSVYNGFTGNGEVLEAHFFTNVTDYKPLGGSYGFNGWPLRKWQTVHVTWDGANVAIYFDGALQTMSGPFTGVTGTLSNSPTYPLFFGGLNHTTPTSAFPGQIERYLVWPNVVLTQAQILQRLAEPYALALPRDVRRFWSMPNRIGIRSYTASGGVTVAGAAVTTKTRSYVASHGVTVGGSAATARPGYTASGGVTVAGAASTAHGPSFGYTASGGVIVGGHAPSSRTRFYAYVSSGGVIVGNTPPPSGSHKHTRVYHVSGGVIVGGNAATAGGHPYIYAAEGGVTVGGSATTYLVKFYAYVASGGVTVAGTALTSGPSGVVVRTYTASGGVTVGGAAACSMTSASNTHTYVASHGVTVAGAATTSFGSINAIHLSGIGPEGGIGSPLLNNVKPIVLHGIGPVGIGTPTVGMSIALFGIAPENGVGTPVVTGAGLAIVPSGIPPGGVGSPTVDQDIVLIGFREMNSGSLSEADLLFNPFSQERIGSPTLSFSTLGIIPDGIAPEGGVGIPFLYDQNAAFPIDISQVLGPSDPSALAAYWASLRPEADAFDVIWKVAQADGTDTIEWKVPISFIDGTGALVLKTKHPNGATVEHPVNHATYTIRSNKQHRDRNGQNYYWYLAQAPHYELGRIAAIPYTTEALGTTVAEILNCLMRVSGGWSFTGYACLPFESPSECTFLGAQFSSQEASVLTQLFQISKTFGGAWRFDELRRIAYLECSVGSGSGITADYQRNLLEGERTEEEKPQQQVLVTASVNGIVSGLSAAMELQQLEADDVCIDYITALKAQQEADAKKAANTDQIDPCVMAGTPMPTVAVKFSSNALHSANHYLREQYLLMQVPQVTLAGAILDISMLPGGRANEGRIPLGQWMTFKDDEAGIFDVVRCVGASYNLLEPEKTTYELSNEVPWDILNLQAPTPKPGGPFAGGGNTSPAAGDGNANVTPGSPKDPNDPSQCLDDSAIEADWIPPPTCVGKGVKLQNSLEDKLAMFEKLLEFSAKIQGATEGQISGLEAAQSVAESQGVSLPVKQYVDGLHATLSKVKQAILTAEVAVLQVQQDIDHAAILDASESRIVACVGCCSEDAMKQANDALQASKDAVKEMLKGHWQYEVNTFKVGDCPTDALPSDPTNLGSGSGLDNAVKSAADGACYFAKVTENTPGFADLTIHGHINCGDITTDETLPGGSGGASGSSGHPNAVSIRGELFQVFRLDKNMIDANVLLNKQFDAITHVDKLAQTLRDNIEECVAKAAAAIPAIQFNCKALEAKQAPPTPDAQPADTGGGSYGYGGGSGGPLVPVPDRGGDLPPVNPVVKASTGDAGQTCLQRAIAIGGLGSGAGSAAADGASSLVGLIAAVDNSRMDASNIGDGIAPPPWPIDVALITEVVNEVRQVLLQTAAGCAAIATDAAQFDRTTIVAAGMSSAVNPANPENSQAISDAGDAQAALQAARDDINAQASALTADASWMDGAWDYVQSALSDLEETLRLWGVTTSGIDPDKLTIDPMTGQPTSSSTDNRTSATIALLPALKALAQISQIRKRMTVQIAAMNHAAAALLDAVDCADSYLVAAGVDVNAQRGQSVSVQNTWSARTPQVDDSPNSNAALDPDYDPTGGDSGNFVPQLWTHDGEPDPTQVNPGDVWIDTSIDLGPIPMVPPP